MNLCSIKTRASLVALYARSFTVVSVFVLSGFALTAPSVAQTVQPLPTATSTPVTAPVTSPTPVPTITPISGATPTSTIIPGVADTDAAMAAYNAAHTPLVNISFVGLPTGIGTTPSVTSVQPEVVSPHLYGQNSVCATVNLPLAATTGTSTPARAAASVLLTYPAMNANAIVWAQMLTPGGTLSATDSTGKTYDGSQGFWLTLDAAGTAKFSYQAPSKGGTYQLMIRFRNVKTILSFQVPDTK